MVRILILFLLTFINYAQPEEMEMDMPMGNMKMDMGGDSSASSDSQGDDSGNNDNANNNNQGDDSGNNDNTDSDGADGLNPGDEDTQNPDYPIPVYQQDDKTASPLNFFSEFTYANSNSTALQLVMNGNATMIVENNAHIMKFTPQNPDNSTYITGGPFGIQKYSFANMRLFWSPDGLQSCCGRIDEHRGFPLAALVCFQNQKYSSFEEAQGQRDGLAIATWPIFVEGNFDNVDFANFKNTSQQITEPGSQTTADVYSSTYWFTSIASTVEHYYYYLAEYYDEVADKSFYSVLKIVFSLSQTKTISWDDFTGSFLQMKGYNNSAPRSMLQAYPQDDRDIFQAQTVSVSYTFSSTDSTS